MTKNDFVKASRGEFSKTQQINYSTVLPGFDLVQMADDCNEYILTKNRLSDVLSNEPPLKCPSSGGGGGDISHLLLALLFINLVISLFVYLFILLLSIFLLLFFYFINHR